NIMLPRARNTTPPQIILFGITGGLIPCPAAITVLLLYLQLKQLGLGMILFGCFSIGLAMTMVVAGVTAALGVRHIQSRWNRLTMLASRVPYASSVLILLIAVYMGISGWMELSAGPSG
ncbi:MAG: sulfite exporter TauE/SafE family protein, partial [Proteobacteria bacterium]|nr:sulfite exporter TauE/SafE family protein [Pseudomonadota bacterium]